VSDNDMGQRATELRLRAEENLRQAAQLPEAFLALSPEETRRTLHELRVHQIELEMQNTELRRAQTDLESERQRYFDLYEMAPVGYCTVSTEGLITRANLSAVDLLGITRDARAGRLIFSRFILEEDQDIYYRHRKKVLATAATERCELRMVKKDGSGFWAHLEISLGRDGGDATVYRIVLSDISARKQADEALKKTTVDLHERVKELSCLYGISKLVEEDDLTIDEIVQRTVDLIPSSWQYPKITCARITLSNRSYKTKQFIKTDWFQSQEIRVNKEHLGCIEVFFIEKKPEKAEGPFLLEERSLLNAIAERLGRIIERKSADEALRKVNDELQLRVEERTKELAVQNLHLLKEVRERKKAEEELQRNSEKIKLFAYSISHDLKNPAISVCGLARILKEKFGNDLSDRGKRICEQIQRSSEDITSLVERINLFISAKETPLSLRKISLNEVFLMLQEEFSNQLNIRSIQLFIPDNLPDVIVADRLSIIRIFRNIIENSLKYGGNALGMIEIGYRLNNDLHIVKVTDDGQGIKGNDSIDIFNWFKRKTNSTEIQGTGMGLAIVQEIAALHGGEVWLEPVKPTGVTFCVSLSRHLMPIDESAQK
jgi:PAS domain S-box-containing protein